MDDGEQATAAAMTLPEQCSRILGRVRRSLLPNCREMSRRTSDSLERRLGLFERFGGALHLAMCGTCRRYRVQVYLLHRAARHWRPEGGSAKRLSPEARERIKQALRKRHDDHAHDQEG
jgi:hypothetical protein